MHKSLDLLETFRFHSPPFTRTLEKKFSNCSHKYLIAFTDSMERDARGLTNQITKEGIYDLAVAVLAKLTKERGGTSAVKHSTHYPWQNDIMFLP